MGVTTSVMSLFAEWILALAVKNLRFRFVPFIHSLLALASSTKYGSSSLSLSLSLSHSLTMASSFRRSFGSSFVTAVPSVPARPSPSVRPSVLSPSFVRPQSVRPVLSKDNGANGACQLRRAKKRSAVPLPACLPAMPLHCATQESAAAGACSPLIPRAARGPPLNFPSHVPPPKVASENFSARSLFIHA